MRQGDSAAYCPAFAITLRGLKSSAHGGRVLVDLVEGSPTELDL